MKLRSDIHFFLEMARSTEYHALFYAFLFTGCRRAELLALRWQDVDMLLCQMSINRSLQYVRGMGAGKRITFKEPKTAQSRRSISLSPSMVEVLREHREARGKLRQSLGLPSLSPCDLVFSRYDGAPLLPQSVTQAWQRLARRTGLRGVRLHDARHTHASLMLKQGAHPKIVQQRLGHASIQITLDTYSHVPQGCSRPPQSDLTAF
jgi:integrase